MIHNIGVMSCCGTHVDLQSNLYQTVSTIPGPCQFFMTSPRGYGCRHFTDDDKIQTMIYCREHQRRFYVHSPYVVNLAKTECDNSIRCLQKHLDELAGLPASVVLHFGRVGTVEHVAEALNQLTYVAHPVPAILIENAAGQGTELGCRWTQFRHLFEALDHNRIGLCWDTQHAFAAGLSTLNSAESVDRLLSRIHDMIGPKNPLLIHLNDSKIPFEGKVDRHENLGQGHIWSTEESREGLAALIMRGKEQGIDLVLETPSPWNDLELITKYEQGLLNC